MRKCDNPNCEKLTKNPRFCGQSCSAKITNTEKPLKARLCKYPECTTNHPYNRLYCKAHKGGLKLRFNLAMKRTLGETLSKLGHEHPSWVMSHVRQSARNNYKDLVSSPCEACGYDKHVELCHIRSIKSFPMSATIGEINDRSNIKVLCPNCHWEFDNL